MKKSYFITGAVYLAFGCLMLAVALLTESRLEGILFGLAGAGIVPGIQMIVQYFTGAVRRTGSVIRKKESRKG